MTILGFGIDLVETARIERMLADHADRFIARCFTAGERAYCEESGRRSVERFAARFAAKEAVLKALGTGWRDGVAWTDVEVIREPSGQPRIVLHGKVKQVAEQASITHWQLSLTHTEHYAMAGAIATGQPS